MYPNAGLRYHISQRLRDSPFILSRDGDVP